MKHGFGVFVVICCRSSVPSRPRALVAEFCQKIEFSMNNRRLVLELSKSRPAAPAAWTDPAMASRLNAKVELKMVRPDWSEAMAPPRAVAPPATQLLAKRELKT